MAELVAETGVGVVLMHMKGTPRDMQQDPHYEDVVSEVAGFLAERASYLIGLGVGREAIAVDPGIGFGKTVEHNLQLTCRPARSRRPWLPGGARSLEEVLSRQDHRHREPVRQGWRDRSYHGPRIRARGKGFSGPRCFFVKGSAGDSRHYRGPTAMGRMVAGLKPRGFTWVITDRLAVSERVGGSGFQHRRVRREEEITWLVEEAGINSVVSMLPGNQNLLAYKEAGMATYSVPVAPTFEAAEIEAFFATLSKAMTRNRARVLVHRETIDDTVGGLLGGLSRGLRPGQGPDPGFGGDPTDPGKGPRP